MMSPMCRARPLSAPRRHVVGIKIQDLLVFLEREIVASAVVIAVGVAEQLVSVLDHLAAPSVHRGVDQDQRLLRAPRIAEIVHDVR